MAEITEQNSRAARRQKANWARIDARRAKHAIPNGQKAFKAISDMADDIRNIERAEKTLRVLMHSNAMEESERDALWLIADELERIHEGLDAVHSTVWDATWGFVHGPKANAEQVTG